MVKSFTPGAHRHGNSPVYVSSEKNPPSKSRSSFCLSEDSLALSPRGDALGDRNNCFTQYDQTHLIHNLNKKDQFQDFRRNSQMLLNPDATFKPTSEMFKQPEPLGECDYDNNPILLYQAIEKSNWGTATKILDDEHDIEDDSNEEKEELPGGPDAAGGTEHEPGQFAARRRVAKQAATWVVRKESDGKLRWRLLPLHAAIIFKAPIHVMESIVESYPPATKCKDDQGMLPLHLAFRYDSADEVLSYLLSVYPEAIHVKDRKGRTPVVCATTRKTSTLFQRANLISTYADIASSTERRHWVNQANESYLRRINEIKVGHNDQVENMKEKFEQQLVHHIEQIKSLKDELYTVINLNEDLEKNTNTMVKYETKLIAKISELTMELNNVNNQRENESQQLNKKITTLEDENVLLKKQVRGLHTSHGSVVCELNELKKLQKKEQEEKNAMKSAINDAQSHQMKIEIDRHMLSQTVNVLKYTLEKQLEEQSCIRQTLFKQEQDMNSSSMLRQKLLTMLAKQEADVTEVSRLERAKINNILDKRAEEISSVLRQVTTTKQPSLSRESMNNDMKMTMNTSKTSLSSYLSKSKSNISLTSDRDSTNVPSCNSTSLSSIENDFVELMLDSSDSPTNTKYNTSSSLDGLTRSLANETKEDEMDTNGLLLSTEDNDNKKENKVDDINSSLDSIVSPPGTYSLSLSSMQKSKASSSPEQRSSLSKNDSIVQESKIELKSTFDLPIRSKLQQNNDCNSTEELTSISPRVTFKTPRTSRVFAANSDSNSIETKIQSVHDDDDLSNTEVIKTKQ